MVALLGLLVWWRWRASPRVRPFLPALVSMGSILFGVLLALFDQLVTPSLAPLLVANVSMAFLLRLSPRVAVAHFAAGATLFVALAPSFQPGDALRLTTVLNAGSIGLLGAALSLVFTAVHRRDFAQRATIARQHAALEAAIAETRAQAGRARGLRRGRAWLRWAGAGAALVAAGLGARFVLLDWSPIPASAPGAVDLAEAERLIRWVAMNEINGHGVPVRAGQTGVTRPQPLPEPGLHGGARRRPPLRRVQPFGLGQHLRGSRPAFYLAATVVGSVGSHRSGAWRHWSFLERKVLKPDPRADLRTRESRTGARDSRTTETALLPALYFGRSVRGSFVVLSMSAA